MLEERGDRGVGGGQVVVLPLNRGQVLEVPSRLLEQLLVDRGQAVGQRVRDLGRVEVLGQQRPAQRDQQIQELGVTLASEAEQAGVDRVLVGALALAVAGVAAQRLGELLRGQWPGVGRQQAEVDAHPQVGHVERRLGPVPVLVRDQPDDQRHRVARTCVPSLGRANSIQT